MIERETRRRQMVFIICGLQNCAVWTGWANVEAIELELVEGSWGRWCLWCRAIQVVGIVKRI